MQCSGVASSACCVDVDGTRAANCQPVSVELRGFCRAIRVSLSPVVILAKEAVNAAFNTTLDQGKSPPPLASPYRRLMCAGVMAGWLAVICCAVGAAWRGLAWWCMVHAGMRVERRLFHSTFALADRREGMTAFALKRKPVFSHL